MSQDRELLERAIDEAYRAQDAGTPDFGQVRDRVIRRGRRRRAGRLVGSVALIALLAGGAAASVSSLPKRPDRPRPANAPNLGAEKVLEFGGPLAAYGDHLLVANSSTSNGAGDKGSIERLNVATGEVSRTPPTPVTDPLDLAVGPSGVWLVQWTGDMPVGGEGHPVRGVIQLVDPITGELIHDLRLKDSAPYDVAAAATGSGESAWVVDYARDELLQLDAGSGEVVEVVEIQGGPNSVAVARDAVWVASNHKSGGTLYRYGLDGSGTQAFPVDHCLNDLMGMGDSVWAVDYCGGRVHRFDGASGDKTASIEVGERPGGLATAQGLLWVTRGSEVLRIDPERAALVGEPVVVAEGAEHIAAVGDVVFVSTFEGVFRLGEDAPQRELEPTPAEPEPPEGGDAAEGCDHERVLCVPLDRPMAEVAVGFGTAWVGNIGEGETFGVARFEDSTGEEVARLRTDGFVKGFAATEEHMWLLLEQGEESVLQQIDPATTEVLNSYTVGTSGNIGEPSITVGDGSVWASGPRGVVARVTTATGAVDTYDYSEDLPGYRVDNGPLHLAYGDGQLWLSYGTGDIGIVDPQSGELERVEEGAFGVNAYDITIGSGQIWSPHQTVDGTNVISYAPTTSGPSGLVELPPGNPIAADSDGQRLWVLQDTFSEDQAAPGWLLEVDPIDHETLGDPLSLDLGFRGDLAVGEGFIWVTGNNVLYRIDLD